MSDQTTRRFRSLVPLLPGSKGKTGRTVLGLAALLAWAATVHAGPVTADYTGPGLSLAIEYTLQDVPGQSQPLPHQLTQAGELNWTTVSGVPGLPSQFVSFCIELTQQISSNPSVNPYSYNVVSLESSSQPALGTTKANEIRQLWGMFFADVNSDATAAAFQIAIWEIIYGSEFTPYPHNIPGFPQIAIEGATAIAQAATWVSDVQTPDPSAYDNSLVALTSPTYQDQLVSLAPGPGGFTLAGIGFLTLLGYRRRLAN